jgi:LacI family transcriptional regulator, galactose operon repressor
MPETVTIKDIARLAGVSIGTVDRVLHDRGRVAPETAETVRRLILETGFRPNLYASNLAQARTSTLGILTPLPEQDSGFWQLPHNGMRRAAEELLPFSIDLRFHCFDRFSEDSFREAVAELAAEKPDGILLAPIMPGPAQEIGRLLPAGIPLCCFDSDLPELEKLVFIGQDPYMSGRLAGKLMRLLTTDRGSTVIIQAVQADYHIRGRVEGFRSFYPRKNLPRLYEEKHFDTPRTRTAFMDELFSDDPDIRGIFVINSSVHQAAEYLNERGLQHIGLIGYDLIGPNMRHLETGTIDFLISQRPELQGYRGVFRLFEALNGRPGGEARETMPVDILTAENLRDYIPFR